MRPTILCDVDGVLADFVAAYLRLVWVATGREFKHEHVTEFYMAKALGLTDEETADVNSRITPGWCANLEPLPGAIDGIRALESVADVYVVTSPWNKCMTWTYEREQWLAKHFGIPHARVIHGSAKHLVRGDMLIDDKADTVIKWQAAHPGKTAVMWQAPWNERAEWAGVLTNDWERVRRLAEAIR